MSKLNVAVVGVANHAASNLAAMRGQRVLGICDVDEDYLERARQKFPSARFERDWRELLQLPQLDAVVISIPDHGHAACALMAIERGLHVYCEKPLAQHVNDTRGLARAAVTRGVVTQMGNQHQSSPGYQRAIQLLRAGVLGQLSRVSCWTDRPIWPQGISRPRGSRRIPRNLAWDLWLGPAPRRAYHPVYHPLSWRGWWDFGTGALGDMGPHLLDPVFAGLDLTAPRRVEASTTSVNRWTFPASSHIRWLFETPHALESRLLVEWFDGGRKPQLRSPAGQPLRLAASGVLVEGERGSMFIPALGGDPRLLGAAAKQVLPPTPEPCDSHQQQWLTACQQGTDTQAGFAYGARLSESCLLGNVAIRSGNVIQWDGDKGVVVNHPELNRWLHRPVRAGWEVRSGL